MTVKNYKEALINIGMWFLIMLMMMIVIKYAANEVDKIDDGEYIHVSCSEKYQSCDCSANPRTEGAQEFCKDFLEDYKTKIGVNP